MSISAQRNTRSVQKRAEEVVLMKRFCIRASLLFGNGHNVQKKEDNDPDSFYYESSPCSALCSLVQCIWFLQAPTTMSGLRGRNVIRLLVRSSIENSNCNCLQQNLRGTFRFGSNCISFKIRVATTTQSRLSDHW